MGAHSGCSRQNCSDRPLDCAVTFAAPLAPRRGKKEWIFTCDESQMPRPALLNNGQNTTSNPRFYLEPNVPNLFWYCAFYTFESLPTVHAL